MVQRLSWEEVLLSTLTEPSLMKDRVPEGVFDVSRHLVAGKSDSAKDTNDRASDGGSCKKQGTPGPTAVEPQRVLTVPEITAAEATPTAFHNEHSSDGN